MREPGGEYDSQREVLEDKYEGLWMLIEVAMKGIQGIGQLYKSRHFPTVPTAYQVHDTKVPILHTACPTASGL